MPLLRCFIRDIFQSSAKMPEVCHCKELSYLSQNGYYIVVGYNCSSHLGARATAYEWSNGCSTAETFADKISDTVQISPTSQLAVGEPLVSARHGQSQSQGQGGVRQRNICCSSIEKAIGEIWNPRRVIFCNDAKYCTVSCTVLYCIAR